MTEELRMRQQRLRGDVYDRIAGDVEFREHLAADPHAALRAGGFHSRAREILQLSAEVTGFARPPAQVEEVVIASLAFGPTATNLIAQIDGIIARGEGRI